MGIVLADRSHMKRRILFVLAAVSVLALMALYFLETRRPRVGAPDLPQPGSQGAHTTGLDAATEPTGPGHQRSSSLATTTSSTVDASRVDRPGFDLRTVQHDTGQPIADAEVFVLELTTQLHSDFILQPVTLMARAVASGERTTSDDLGRVRLPLSIRSLFVYARHGSFSGCARIPPHRLLPRELVLHDDWNLEVHVTDEYGTPQPDVPVSLITESGEFGPDYVCATTDAEGAATLEHTGLFVALGPSSASRVRLLCALDPQIDAPVDDEMLRTHRAKLVMPATGEVEVLLQREDGSSLTEPVAVNVSVAAMDGIPVDKLRQPRTEQLAKDGRALFRHVQLHARISARSGTNTVLGAGPAAPNERVTFVVKPQTSDRPLLHGRVLDASGNALAHQELSVQVSGSVRPPQSLSTDTDQHGEFRVPLPANVSGEIELRFLQVDASSSRIAERTLTLTGPLPPGTTELGDMSFAEPSLACDGRVVDESGVPVSGAKIDLQGTDGHEMTANLHGMSDGDGRFELRGVRRGNAGTLNVMRAGFGPTMIELTPDQTHVEVVLPKEGRIEGSLAVSKTLDRRDVVVTCVGRLDQWITPTMESKPDLASGAFVFDSLRAAHYEVGLSTRNLVGGPALLASIDASAGDVSRDPRLQDIDADRWLHSFRFDVRTADERSQAFAFQARAPGRYGVYERRSRSKSDSFPLFSASEELEIRVRADGYRTHVAMYRPGSHVITLLPGIEVKLVFRGEGELPKTPFHVSLGLRMRDDAKGSNGLHVPFDERGECLVRVSEPGEYKIILSLRRGEQPRSTEFEALVPAIAVKDVSTLQTFDVRVSREALERALAEASR